MKLVVSIVAFATALALVSSDLCLADQQQQQQQQQASSITNKQQQQLAPTQQNNNNNNERQGRSISSSGGNGNSLHSMSNSNIIDHSSPSKSRLELEKRQVADFATTRNLIKTLTKLVFGSPEDVHATSRSVLSVISKVLDLLKNTFGQKARSSSARTIRDSAEDVATASVSMLQGYVKSVLAGDGACVKRHLCQAAKEAAKDGRDAGWMIATVGGYATSYLLDSTRRENFKEYHEASLRGRSLQGGKEECIKYYPECQETI